MLTYDFNYTPFTQKVEQLYASLGPRQIRNIVRDVATEATEWEMDVARRILSEETNGTGRLSASMGKFDDGWLKERDPDAGPADAYWEEYFDGDEYYIVAGSNLDYAAAINYGFQQDDTRKVFLQREGRWVTVKPFSYGGLHYLERAADEVAADKSKVDQIVAKNLQKRVIGWGVS